MESFFDEPLIRFGTSGTLILIYGLADGWARRAGSRRPQRLPESAWIRVVLVLSITAFYVLIGPAGGPLLNGVGNLAGVLAVGLAAALRIALRNGHPQVRYPETATRVLFYAALPLAVGVPFGWLALTLPATVTSALASVRADRVRREEGIDATPGIPAPRRTFRWIPHVW